MSPMLCRLRNVHSLKKCPFKGCLQCICGECRTELKNGICKTCKNSNGNLEIQRKFESLSIKNKSGINKKSDNKSKKNIEYDNNLEIHLVRNNLCDWHKMCYDARLEGRFISKKNKMDVILNPKQKMENFRNCFLCRNELWNTREYRKKQIYQEIQEI